MEDLDLTQASDYQAINHYDIPNEKIPTYNPFDVFVKKDTVDNGSLNSKIKAIDFNLDNNAGSNIIAPIRVSTKNVQEYISKGFKLTDLDLNSNLENDLSSTQGYWERKANNLKNAGANFVSMAVVTGLSNPLDMGLNADLSEGTIAKKLFDWSASVQKDNYNYQTREDTEAEGVWDNLTNWVNPLKNSTKGVGTILESVGFGLGASAGIYAQTAVTSFLTGGTGTIPLLASKLQKVFNTTKYLDKALDVSKIAEQAAINLKNVIKVGDITSSTAKALKGIYRSQLGSHSEALFEGLEGKESLKNQLINEYEEIHGFKPTDEVLANIEKTSTDAGQARYGVNRALLSLTNLSQFNSLFKAFDPQKEIADGMLEKFGKEITFDEATKKVIAKKTGYEIKSAWFDKGVKNKILKPVIEGTVNFGKKEIVNNGLMEGVEEGLQFFTDKALNNYYSWKYHGDNKSVSDALYEGTKELFTKEGIESIFTGIVSGAGQSAVTKYFASLSPNFKAQKKLFEGRQNELVEDYNKIDEKFQALPLEFKKKLVHVMNQNSLGGTVADKTQILSASSGTANILEQPEDEEQFNQALSHQFFTLALPYAKHGNIDILKAQFEEYKNQDEESFKNNFGLSNIKNKDEAIALYLKEFDAIQEAYRKSNNAFAKLPEDPLLQTEYQNLKTELAFSLYNSDKLIKDAKTLETAIGDNYKGLLSKTEISQTTINNNNKEIEELKKEIETPENNSVIAGLEKYNSYIEKILSGKKELKREEYLNVLNDEIVKPSVNKKYSNNSQLENSVDLNDKLNKIYQLSKIKDRVLYTQDKLNKILNSDSPLNYLRQQENAFENEAYTFSKKINPNPVIENKNIVETVTNEDLDKLQNEGVVDEKILNEIANKELSGKPLSTNESKIATDKRKEINEIKNKIKQNEEQLNPILNPEEQELPVVETPIVENEEIIPEEIIEEDYELDNIESKQYEAVFLIDENGNILEGENDYNERSKDLINLLNNSDDQAINNFTNSINYRYIGYEDGESKIKGNTIPVRFPMEKALAKLSPKEGIRLVNREELTKKENNIGFISTSDDLYVDLTTIENSLGKGKFDSKKTLHDNSEIKVITDGENNKFITYTAFLQILKDDVDLFNNIKKKTFEIPNSEKTIPLLFKNVQEDIPTLINKQNAYLKSKAKLLSLLRKDENELKEFIIKHQMIDFQAFINRDKKNGLYYNIKETLLFNETSGLLHGHLVNVVWNDTDTPNISYVSDLYPTETNARDIKLGEQTAISEYILTQVNNNLPGNRKYIVVKQKDANGSISWKLLDTVNQSLLIDNLTETISDVNELKSYLETIDIQSKTINGVKYSNNNKVKFSIAGFPNKKSKLLDIKIAISFNDGEVMTEVIKIAPNTSKKDILDVVKERLDKGYFGEKETRKDLKLDVTLYNVGANQIATKESINNIKINSYFDARKNPKQIYTTLYLKIKPLSNLEDLGTPIIQDKNVTPDNINFNNVSDINDEDEQSTQTNFIEDDEEQEQSIQSNFNYQNPEEPFINQTFDDEQFQNQTTDLEPAITNAVFTPTTSYGVLNGEEITTDNTLTVNNIPEYLQNILKNYDYSDAAKKYIAKNSIEKFIEQLEKKPLLKGIPTPEIIIGTKYFVNKIPTLRIKQTNNNQEKLKEIIKNCI